MESDDKSSTPPFEEISFLNLEEMSAENQRQADATDSLINNSVIQAIVDKFNLDNFAKNHPLADDIENGVKELIKENNKLKDCLIHNNDSKIQHFHIVQKWLKDVQTIHISYKRQLDEARTTIEELKAENMELRKPQEEIIRAVETQFQKEKRKLMLEKMALRDKLEALNGQMKTYLEQSVHSAVKDNDSEFHRILKKLEESERERRKLTIERDRFLGQEMKVQQMLGAGDSRNVTNLYYWNHEFPDVILSGQKESQLKEELKELDKILQSEEITFSQTNSAPELSSSSTTEESSVEQMKEEILALRKQVLNERAVCTLCRKLLSDVRSKFRVVSLLTLSLLKEHDSKIRSLEISLVKAKNDIDLTSLRLELSDKQDRIAQLESELVVMKEKLNEANKLTERFFVLQSQMKVYEEDYLSIRSERDALSCDKRILEQNVNSLSQDNAKLRKQLRVPNESDTNNLTKNEQSMSPPYQYECINDTCHQSFASEDELQTHIYSCLNLKD